MKTVGAYEAKTQFSRLLGEVGEGETITITKNGKPVAILGPYDDRRSRMSALIAEIKVSSRKRSLGGIPVRELIDDGRKY